MFEAVLIGGIIYALVAFLAFAAFFVGGKADAAVAHFLKQYERDQ